ncbi:MAG: hypothetical protein HKN43_07505 [Rhodothermales bacterium]|nr:hypothetical protein [Rhodothermales bacterium]
MKQFTTLAFPLLLAGLLLAGCDAFKSEDAGPVNVSGRVIDQDQLPLENARVEVRPLGEVVFTAADGTYALDFDVDSTSTLSLSVSKAGYGTNSSTQFTASADEEINLPTIQLNLSSSTPTESGQASNILLSSQSSSAIGVTESGSEEVAQIRFQVTDSTGTPITLSNAIDISFAIGAGPGGGEFLFPSSVRTDNAGFAEVNLSAGTTAGVVQVVASASVNGNVIRSLPVAMSIHGGLPDAGHFTLGPEKFNFPGLLAFSIENGISVLAGDKWFNPVRPGTAVYFTSTHGVIEGSTLTDAQGQGSVNLLSGNPIPPDGVSVITAITADENQQEVSAQTPVLWTGSPIITLTQTSSSSTPFLRTYDFTVNDRNGNPLAEGTSIGVSVAGEKVIATGNVATRLSDTIFLNGGTTYADVLRGPGITEFSFAVVEDPDGDSEDTPSIAQVTVSVSGPNGNLELTYGVSGVSTSTEGAEIQHIDDNTVVVKAREDF